MKFVAQMRRRWANFRSGIAAFVGRRTPEKPPHSDADPKPLRGRRQFDDSKLPSDFPDSESLRLVADYLDFLTPAEDALALTRAREYTAAHELAGVHEAINTIRQWADDMDEINRLTSSQEEPSL